MSQIQPTSSKIAALLEEFAERLALVGVSKFKIRAYRTAAANLKSSLEPISELIESHKLKTIPGVGDAIAEKIETLYRTGTHPNLEKLRSESTGWFPELASIPITKAQLKILSETLKVNDSGSLQEAANKGLIEKTRGLGKRLQAAILSRCKPGSESEKLRLNRANAQATHNIQQLKARYKDLDEILSAGDVRRGCELCSETKYILLGKGSSLQRVRAANNPLLIASDSRTLGVALLYATGSSAHVALLENLAQSKGFELNEFGLYRESKQIEISTEEELYETLGLQFIEPELREGTNEISLATKRALPKLVRIDDLRGVLHFHTADSDGKNSLSEMAEAAALLGLEYCGVCDHSQLASYAGGLTFDRVLMQHRLADSINAEKNEKSAFIFKGIESDIRKDGALDFTPQELAHFDFVVASVHARFGLSRDEQTARLVKAVKNPFTTILGHPTGRLLQSREPYEADMLEVLKTCADRGVAVEINGDPYRMDLDWRWHRRASDLGCIFSIDPDAHDTKAFSYLRWGTAMARKGGLKPAQVLNCLSKIEIEKYFAARKKKAVRKRPLV